jgi:hypothetical protein
LKEWRVFLSLGTSTICKSSMVADPVETGEQQWKP